MREVSIFGLYNGDSLDLKPSAIRGEMWALNDWYMSWGVLNPHRIYNVHPFPHRHPSPERFVDWREHYAKALSLGSQLWTAWTIDGFECHQLPLNILSDVFGSSHMSCSLSIMIYHAILEGVDTIHLEGMRMNEPEYEYQVIGILSAIEQARGFGKTVTCRHEKEWLERRETAMPKLPWSDVNSIIPYWMRVPECPQTLLA